MCLAIPAKVKSIDGVEAEVEVGGVSRKPSPDKAVVFGRALVEHPQAAALLQAVENLGWATGALAADRSSVVYLGPHCGVLVQEQIRPVDAPVGTQLPSLLQVANPFVDTVLLLVEQRRQGIGDEKTAQENDEEA